MEEQAEIQYIYNVLENQIWSKKYWMLLNYAKEHEMSLGGRCLYCDNVLNKNLLFCPEPFTRVKTVETHPPSPLSVDVIPRCKYLFYKTKPNLLLELITG